MIDKEIIEKIVKTVMDEYKPAIEKTKNKENTGLTFPISVSNRHAHISQEHLEILFGRNYALKIMKDLSQPGQYAAHEKIIIAGSKGCIDSVRILGPVRKKTQVEISITDSYRLGIKPVIRESGDLSDTPGLTIVGPVGSVFVKEGAIVAKRHIHCTPEQAEKLGVKDNEIVNVKVDNERGGIFSNVVVRVSKDFSLDMHIDTDEGNAFAITPGTVGKIISNSQ
ncbi:MAG: phosphate propanoyltransferase [Candidatus Muiribacteriota bacterium]